MLPSRSCILLAESREENVYLFRRGLEQHGVDAQLVVARDGVTVLDRLLHPPPGAVPEAPGVVVLHLRLPDTSALEVLRHLRSEERTRRLPVVVVSSSVDDEARRASLDAGADAFIRRQGGMDEMMLLLRRFGIGAAPEPGTDGAQNSLRSFLAPLLPVVHRPARRQRRGG